MKKAAALAVMFLALTTVFVYQHEKLHQQVAREYGCQASEIQFLSPDDLDEYSLAELPVAYVETTCEDSETFEKVRQLNMVVEIVGYQSLLTFLLAASILTFQFYNGHKVQQSLNRLERTQAILIEEQGLQPGTEGENHQL